MINLGMVLSILLFDFSYCKSEWREFDNSNEISDFVTQILNNDQQL